MRQLTYRMTFDTPAFLGNAEQAAQWRTPPIKALLRQWWRVVYASTSPNAGIDSMRRAEGLLFGVAADNGGSSRKSALRLRLDEWRAGNLKSWSGLEPAPVAHPEVERAGRRVGAHVYLGFGPLTVQGRETVLTKGRAAIQVKDSATLRLAMPEGTQADRICAALSLLDLYGTLGGRSRNGWGSFGLAPLEGTPALEHALDASLLMPWQDALKQDWPQAIGSDGKGALIWQTDAAPDWKQMMRRLAEVKIGLRTGFVFTTGKDAPRPEARHWLSYPVTNHSVRDWGGNARLPNSLRFKVRPTADGKLHGVIFHMPCLPPPAFQPDRAAIAAVWQRVHARLDADKSLQRIPA